MSRPPLTFYQPFKAVYITSRLLALIVLIPSWAAYYALFSRPRKSWTLKESINVNLIRWIMPLNAQCNLGPLCTDKTKEVSQKKLKETSFAWLEPADNALLRGIARDDKVGTIRVPGYIWPKAGDLSESDGLVGLWLHGGGYMMGNGMESFPESDIPRHICRNSKLNKILSVDYRLSGEACHPAQLLDALAGYAHLVGRLGIDPSRIAVFGACAGGHLALLLMRYLYEEKVMPLPGAMMLFSPWVDMVIDKKIEGDPSLVRPNSESDMLSASYLANLRFLGHHPESMLSEPAFSANLAPPASFTGYPKTFLSVGDAEAFKRECDELESAFRGDGVDITYDVQPDAVHDFWGTGSLVPSENARENVSKHVYEWIASLEETVKTSN